MLRIKKIDQLSNHHRILMIISFLTIGVILISGYLLVRQHNPVNVMVEMLIGSFGSKYRISSTINYAIPLITTALGISVAFKMRFWNIGAEGQILTGAIFATYVALNYSTLPKVALLLIMLIAGFIGGALYGMIAALLKINFNTNETIITLMLNYISLSWVGFLQYEAWKDPNSLGFPKIPSFSQAARLPRIVNINSGIVISILIGLFVYYFLKYSKKGFEISVIGESENTAKYAGMNIDKNTLLIMLISGGICGMVGFIQSSGSVNTLTVSLTMGVGYTAIIIAWLSNLDVKYTFIIGFLFAIMTQGGHYLESAIGLHYNSVSVIQAFILFLALTFKFFMNYQLVRTVRSEHTC
ncbi:ABC transporter permease [Haloplasma contractile]|uniref:Nucleoside ABC transporter membrane protein n=1 Tax=Haloplasma contractile SSD-17B TaxID=1033810 RepID=U2E7N7_9MOLU|nr:ABC transporter permease [Haloplasma contractile]ERJ11213.1 Nucleoside ABC transporter membrane protein [Haloplasma contractile SSD-17B]